MQKPANKKAANTVITIAIGLLITIAIAAGTYVSHKGALQNVRVQGISPTPVQPNPVPKFPTQPFSKPWR